MYNKKINTYMKLLKLAGLEHNQFQKYKPYRLRLMD